LLQARVFTCRSHSCAIRGTRDNLLSLVLPAFVADAKELIRVRFMD
jgi:hypothetical protein